MTDLSIPTNDIQSGQTAENLITQHIDIWTTAIERKSSAGRGTSNKFSLYGIKKLRELILELAVRGKLVPQDVNDEPASVLLERIAAEKAQLVKEGKLKNQKPLPVIGEDEKPFELPNGWEFERFGNVYSLEYGDNLPKPKRSGTGEVDVYGSNGVVGTHNQKSVDLPCIVVGRKGSAGALNLCNSEGCWITDVAYSTVPPVGISLRFAFLQFHTLELDTLGKGIKPGLNRNEAYVVVLALPPLEEQHRIVAKVDELMSLCDALEAQTEASISAHQTLVETLLKSLIEDTSGKTSMDGGNVENAGAIFDRIAEHFDTLFTTEASIDTLKQTILQLAVMGKLVEQDPNDEPAAKLLERITAEKAQLIKDGKIKKQKPLPEICEHEKPFELPKSWAWARLGEYAEVKGGKRLPKGHTLISDKTAYAYIRVTDMKDGSVNLHGLQYLTADTQKLIQQYTISKNDLYITIAGTIGEVGSIPEELDGMNLTENAAKIIFNQIDRLWLKRSLSANFSMSQFIEKVNQLAQPKLALHRILSSILPIPPIEEQHRIVTKVDELMTLCDQLKARLSDAQTTQLHLTDAIVEQAI